MNPDTLHVVSAYLFGLGEAEKANALVAAADAWEADIIAWCDTTVERDALRQRLERYRKTFGLFADDPPSALAAGEKT
jgi:hypothetical protein